MTLATIGARLEGLVDKLGAIVSGAEANATKISDLTRRLDEAGVSISAITAERDALAVKLTDADAAKAAAEKSASEAAAKAAELEAKEQSLDARAGAKALEIVAAQGATPPIKEANPKASAAAPKFTDALGRPLTGLDLAKAAHAAASQTVSK